MAGVSHQGRASARDPERLARVPKRRELRHRREGDRYLWQRHDEARRGPDQVSDPRWPQPRRLGTPSRFRSGASRAKEHTSSTVCVLMSMPGAQRLPRCERDHAAAARILVPDEHLSADGRPFRFYFCQREAVETFIYLAEIERVRLVSRPAGLRDAGNDRRARRRRGASGSRSRWRRARARRWR